MKRLIVISLIAPLAAACLGCAAFSDAQADLITQSRRGIELAESNRAGGAALHAELFRLKRQRLDEAFDADVRAIDEDLTPGWVIDHRIGYAAALEAFAIQRFEQVAADETARRNLRAVDGALERLAWLQSIQRKWTTPPQEELP